MKLALVFLAALVVITHQQFQRTRGMLWMSPNSPRPAANYYQPIYYDDIKENVPFPRYFRPPEPSSDSLDEAAYPALMGYESPNNYVANNYESRNNGLNRYQPFNSNPDPRFFFFVNKPTNANNFLFKTATFTLTSTVTVATVQTCVPASQFVNPAPPACRRKRDIDDSSSVLEDVQFPITPSKTQQVIPTALPSLDRMMRENRQLAPYNDAIDSSKVEHTFSEISRNLSPDISAREKRFFANHYYASTTVTSYFLIPTVILQTITLGPPMGILCLPAGYITC